jgi:hypothetical protein
MICFIQELQQAEFDSHTTDLSTHLSTFPPRHLIDPEWCIDLLERFAEKHRNPLPRPLLDVDEPD